MDKILILIGYILFTTFVTGCKYKESEPKKKNPIEIQFISSTVEGITVCNADNSICKKTDSKGMVSFKKFGRYSFKIRKIYLGEVYIETKKTIITPYKLYENDQFAEEVILLLHALDKGKNPIDRSVLLSFSPYISEIDEDSVEAFIANNKNDNKIQISTKDDNMTIDFEHSMIGRHCNEEYLECREYNITISEKEAYFKLDNIATFIGIAEDENVSMDGLDDLYGLKQESLTSFILDDRYKFDFYPEKEEIKVDIYDAQTKTTDTATLSDETTERRIVTDLVEIEIF